MELRTMTRRDTFGVGPAQAMRTRARTRSERLSRPRCERLATTVRDTLARALELGGSTLRDFRDTHGMAGAFQNHAKVYGRAGQPCLHCTTPIRRIVQGQRASYFCPVCQRR